MHKFIEYISDLLFLHDCVIIPDFGGFICNYKSAYIDENSGLICPPSKDILFNRNLTHNDGLLVNWIVCKEHISYEKATSQVSLFCEDLKIRLNQKQRIAFGDIGVFYTDRRFNVIFEPARNNFFAETFGMEPIEIPAAPVEEKIKAQRVPLSPGMSTELSSYLNAEASGNLLHRLLKYALGATAIAGIIVITQLDIFHPEEEIAGKITNHSAVQPAITLKSSEATGRPVCHTVISPEHDYIDYDPANDLRW